MENLALTLMARPWIAVLVVAGWVGGCLLIARMADRTLAEVED